MLGAAPDRRGRGSGVPASVFPPVIRVGDLKAPSPSCSLRLQVRDPKQPGVYSSQLSTDTGGVAQGEGVEVLGMGGGGPGCGDQLHSGQRGAEGNCSLYLGHVFYL